MAQRLGVSRQTVHTAAAAWPTWPSGSSRPDRCPHQTPAELEATIVTMRRAHPAWGPRRIRIELDRAGTQPLPARSTVYRILVRNGLVDPQRRRRRREDYRRWERSRSMELWQMDVMGRVRLRDGSELVGGHRHRRPLPLLRLRPAGAQGHGQARAWGPEIVCGDALVEIFHRGVLIVSRVARHRAGATARRSTPWPDGPAPGPETPLRR